MTNLNGLTLAATIPVAALASDVALDTIVAGSDITTNNVSSAKHGLTPKLPADATKYLDGSGAWTVPAGSGGSAELGYTQITSAVNVASTTEATGTTIITASAITFDGTAVIAEFFSPDVRTPSNAAGDFVVVNLFEGATQIGRLGLLKTVAAVQMIAPVYARLRFTPTAASHTYTLTAYANTTSGTPSVNCGAGGTGVEVPAFLRFSRA